MKTADLYSLQALRQLREQRASSRLAAQQVRCRETRSELDKARANGDGGGDHARAMAAFLTGRQPRKTHGADIRAGVFPAEPSSRTCPGCPAFFICGPTP